MTATNPAKKFGTIAFVMDDRLSREKKNLLSRKIDALRPFARFEILSSALTENELLKHLEPRSIQLMLLPWYRYIASKKIEAFYGLTRTTGPTCVGYFGDPVALYELGESTEYLRSILLDFTNLSVAETVSLFSAVALEQNRSGIRPLLGGTTPIYTENWYAGGGTPLGPRLDVLSSIPEIRQSPEWQSRSSSIRIAISSFWSLIFEEGPGNEGLALALTSKNPKACFQLGASARCLALRLCYPSASASPRDVLSAFWPKRTDLTRASQLLLRHCDFLRVHLISETQMV